MAKFKVRFKGYDRKEVDAYLHKTTEYHESKLRELEDCIKRLKDENDYLYDLNRTNYEGYEIYSSEDGKILKVYTKLTNIPHLYEK